MTMHKTATTSTAMSRHLHHVAEQVLEEKNAPGPFPCEPFVDADVAAEFLMVKRKTILDWARAGTLPAHRYGRGNRVVWRFRISELAGDNGGARSTMAVRQS
jgi:excisionase family DNA binding protein